MKKRLEVWKAKAAEEAAGLVERGMVVGLGHGSTMAEVVRRLSGSKAIFIPASKFIGGEARRFGLRIDALGSYEELDLVIDGADEVDPDFNMIKGGGGALVREKILARSARREAIVVDSTKLVKRLGERWAVPVEAIPFALGLVEQKLFQLGGHTKLRRGKNRKPYTTDNCNYVIDAKFHQLHDPAALERKINDIPGVVDNGIFIGLADSVIVGHEGGVTTLKSKRDFLRFLKKV